LDVMRQTRLLAVAGAVAAFHTTSRLHWLPSVDALLESLRRRRRHRPALASFCITQTSLTVRQWYLLPTF